MHRIEESWTEEDGQRPQEFCLSELGSCGQRNANPVKFYSQLYCKWYSETIIVLKAGNIEFTRKHKIWRVK
jgi:hypothetical protein